MKANAKKLLALILAMVMCLSLAAPAMAAGAEAVAELAPQNVVAATNTSLIVKSFAVDKDGFTATMSDGSIAGPYKWTEEDKYPAETLMKVTKTEETVAGAKVGEFGKRTKYVVSQGTNVDSFNFATATDAEKKAAKDLTSDPIYIADTKNQITLNDVAWTELTDTQNWVEDGVDSNGNKQFKERQGFIYQEKQDKGDYKYFFKFYATKTSTGASGVSNTTFDKSAKVYYAMATTTGEKLTEDVEIRKVALSDLTVVAPDATTSGDAYNDFYKDRTPVKATDYTATLTGYTNSYNYDFINVNTDVLVAINNAAPVVAFQTGTTAVRSTFGVRLDTTVQVNAKPKNVIVSDQATVAAELKDKLAAGVEIEEISATANNGYWTVTVKKSANAAGAGLAASAEELKDNTAWYDFSAYTTAKVPYTIGAGLADLDKDGSFCYYENATDRGNKENKKVAIIEKGTKVLGPIAVKVKDIPAEVATDSDLKAHMTSVGYPVYQDKNGNEYYLFQSWEALHATLANLTCAKDKQLPYVQFVLNKTINGKDNDAAVVTTLAKYPEVGQIVTAISDEAALVKLIGDDTKNIMLESGTATLAKMKTHINVTEYSETASNCQEPGEKLSIVKCKKCGTIIATDREEIPVITQAVAKNPVAGKNYVYTAAEAKAAGVEEHYIADFKIEKVAATKTQPGKIITHYYCNLKHKDGTPCEHSELATEITVDKVNLEYAGTWSYREWGTQNTQYARDPSMLFGYHPMIFDVDKEFTTVPMTEEKYDHFEWNLSSGAGLQPDGTYFFTADAMQDGTKGPDYPYAVTTTGQYFATATVSGIKLGEKECLDGAATITLNVYKLNYDYSTSAIKALTPEKIATMLADKKIEVVTTATQTKDVVIPAQKTHVDANNDGKCDNCDTEIKQVTPDVPTTDKVLTASMVTVKNLTYTGKKQQPEVTVKAADGTELEEGIDYDVATFKKTAVGTYTITVKGKGDWSGKVKATVKINKAKATLKKKSAPATLTANKKKAVTGQIKMTVTGGKVAKYKVTKKVAGVSVNKSGKITVKKGNKKAGTLKVKVTMKADANHTAAKAVTVKVAIKAAKK